VQWLLTHFYSNRTEDAHHRRVQRDSLLAQTTTKLQYHVHIQVVYKYEVCLSSVAELKHTSQITSNKSDRGKVHIGV
jgi:hypothetical protein